MSWILRGIAVTQYTPTRILLYLDAVEHVGVGMIFGSVQIGVLHVVFLPSSHHAGSHPWPLREAGRRAQRVH